MRSVHASFEVPQRIEETRRHLALLLDDVEAPEPDDALPDLLNPDDSSLVVLARRRDGATLEVAEGPYVGRLDLELHAAGPGGDTRIDARVTVLAAPWWARMMLRVPGVRSSLGRRLREALEIEFEVVSTGRSRRRDADLVEDGHRAEAAAVLRQTVIDPMRPAASEPAVRASMKRSARWVLLAWAVVAAAAVCLGIVVAVVESEGAAVERDGLRIPAEVTRMGSDDFDVQVTAVHEGRTVVLERYVDRVYRTGDRVWLRYDPVTGRANIEGEEYTSDLSENIAAGAGLVVLVGVPCAFLVTRRQWVLGRVLKRHPFRRGRVIVATAPHLRWQRVLFWLRSDGEDWVARVAMLPFVDVSHLELATFEAGCLVAGGGRSAVVWRPASNRLALVEQSLIPWRQRYWERRVGFDPHRSPKLP